PPHLDAVTAEGQEGCRARLDPRLETGDCRQHALLGEILPQHHLEAGPLELLGQGTGVLDRMPQRRIVVGIVRISDHQGLARAASRIAAFLSGGHAGSARETEDDRKDKAEKPAHGPTSCRSMVRKSVRIATTIPVFARACIKSLRAALASRALMTDGCG